MNQLTLEEYRERLNCGDLEGLKFLSSAYDVHHVDENPFNNTVENLIAVPSSEHAQLHAMERHNNLRFAVFTDSVANIKPVGARETYDIQMEGPEHNYVANQIVVHNCGKSALGMQAVAQVQRMGGNALWIETEHTFDRKRAAATGVDLDRLLRAETDSIEGVFRIQDHVVTGIAKVGHTAPFITVTDSITAVTAEYNLKHELAGESRVGLDSMKIKEGLRRLNSKLSKFKVTSLFINHAISTMSGWGNTSRAGGGHGLKLMASFRLQLKHKKELKDQNKVNYGQEILFRVDKLKQSQLQENDITEELIHGRFNSLVSLRNALGHVGLFKRTSNQTGKLFPGTDDEVDFNFRDWPQVVEDVGGQQDLYEMFLGAGVRQGTMQRWGDES